MAEERGMTKWAEKVLDKRIGVLLLVVNMGGAAVCRFLTTFSLVTNQGRQGGMHPVAAENALFWTLIALPIVACFFALNVGWGTIILCYRKWNAGQFWLVAILIWLMALGVRVTHR